MEHVKCNAPRRTLFDRRAQPESAEFGCQHLPLLLVHSIAWVPIAKKFLVISNFPYKFKAEHKASLLLLVVLGAGLAAPTSVRAEVHRGGFTLELSTGVGSFSSFQIDGDDVREPAIVPIAIGIGGFVTDRVAILGRASLVLFTYSPEGFRPADSRLTPQLTRSLFLGTTAQVWLNDSLSIESGLGVTIIGNGPIEAQFNRGLGVPTRLGWSFAEAGNGSFSAVLELLPSFFSRGEATLSSSIGIQWQWL